MSSKSPLPIVTYWHQVYIQSEETTKIGADQVWQIDSHMKGDICMDARSLSQPPVIQWKRYSDMNCDRCEFPGCVSQTSLSQSSST